MFRQHPLFVTFAKFPITTILSAGQILNAGAGCLQELAVRLAAIEMAVNFYLLVYHSAALSIPFQ